MMRNFQCCIWQILSKVVNREIIVLGIGEGHMLGYIVSSSRSKNNSNEKYGYHYLLIYNYFWLPN